MQNPNTILVKQLAFQNTPSHFRVQWPLVQIKGFWIIFTTSSTSNRLNGLPDLHDCVDKLLQLQFTQQALAQEHAAQDVGLKSCWMDRLGFDVCGITKEALLQTKECALELQSIMKRRKGHKTLTIISQRWDQSPAAGHLFPSWCTPKEWHVRIQKQTQISHESHDKKIWLHHACWKCEKLAGEIRV